MEQIDEISMDSQVVKDRIDETLKTSIPSVLYRSIPLSGKMARAKLGLLMFKKRFGSVYAEHIDSLVALELVHLASLLHDDVVDNSDMRRGKPSINKVFGNALAVILGDNILSLAFNIVESLDVEEIRLAFLDVLTRMSKAELTEQLNRYRVVSENTYLEVVRNKTGALFGLATYLPSLFEGDPQEKDYAVGEKVGIFFQMMDDLLDFETPEKVGKTTFLDIKNGVFSFPVMLALKQNGSLEDAIKSGQWHIIWQFMKENGTLKTAKDMLKEEIKKFLSKNEWLEGYVNTVFGAFLSS
ncbi:MAG TPA: polyprenyl synthetase family protein [Thermotogae bacterium]|nr:polyprenyl synthetase family protein [Thermotogota bacterium]